MWPLHYTGHPIFDVGLAAITANSRKPDPAKLTEMDLEDVAAFIERYYTRPPFSTFLTITLMNSDFTQPAYQGDEERKRAYARLLARSLAPELHQSDEVCAFTGLLSSTCYTKQNNKERYWMAWTQNGRVIRWGSFCERLRHGSTFIIKSDQHAGLDNLSPLHYAKPHELEDIPSLALW